MTIEVLDPSYGDDANEFVLAPRLETLQGAVVGIIDNGKLGGGRFFDALSVELRDRYGVAEVVRVTKRSASAPAQGEIFDRAREWHALVAGVGD